MKLNDDAALVFRGFLNLANLDKLKLVEAINDYFDSNDRGPIRDENNQQFELIELSSTGRVCKCCGS
ncbi:MAG: hypothetical protein ABJA02_14180 [Acidobacteriota bacterium]